MTTVTNKPSQDVVDLFASYTAKACNALQVMEDLCVDELDAYAAAKDAVRAARSHLENGLVGLFRNNIVNGE
ncbi:hypothetical protein ACN9MB_13340 [Dyella kyungheensis]|uniref:hypothetical protein n=1 Tax=Dyella kyungheensis TaxID=1242174 RepID=UPI003CFAF76B